MSLTRKDYVMLAEFMADTMPVDGITTSSEKERRQWRHMAEVLASRLAAGNPRFDRDRFLKDCGVA